MNRLSSSSAGGPGGVEINQLLIEADQREQLGRYLGASGSIDEYLGNMLCVYQANLEANVKFQPRPSDLNVTLLKAVDGFPPVMKPHRMIALRPDLPANGWEHVELGELVVQEVPGDHFSMFVEPNDAVTATAVRACLAEGLSNLAYSH